MKKWIALAMLLILLGVLFMGWGYVQHLAAEDCQEGVCLEPGQEVIIYCAGNRFEMEYIDDLNGVARCDESEFLPVWEK